MIIVALHQSRIIAYRILPAKKSCDSVTYLDFLENDLQPEVRRQRIRSPLIYHDNSRVHKASTITAFFARHRWTELKQPGYSPDVQPNDYDLFARLKRPHKGVRFATENDMIRAYENTIFEINRNNDAIGISRLPERWEQVIQNCGDYIV